MGSRGKFAFPLLICRSHWVERKLNLDFLSCSHCLNSTFPSVVVHYPDDEEPTEVLSTIAVNSTTSSARVNTLAGFALASLNLPGDWGDTINSRHSVIRVDETGIDSVRQWDEAGNSYPPVIARGNTD